MANPNNTKPENEANPISISPRDSTPPNDSCASHIDESKSNDTASINDVSNLNGKPNVTKQTPFDVSDSEPCNANVCQMRVGSDEEDTECNHIASYFLKLPTVEQLLSQKDLQQGTSSGKQMKDKRYERKGKFAKVVMNSPNAIRNYAIEKERKHKENEINKTLYVTVYLPTTASKTAVKKAFMEFGEVHTVFAGRFKETDFKGICNGKRHIRPTAFKSKHDLPLEIQFPDDDRYFHVMWAEKKILCKKCFSVHMISKGCNDDRKIITDTKKAVS